MKFPAWIAMGILAVVPCASSAPQDEFTLVLGRCREYLLAPPRKADDAQCRIWLEQLDAQGQWPDVVSSFSDNSKKPVSEHLERIKQWAIAWQTPGSPLREDAHVRAAIDRALDWWLQARPKSGNWWYNEIGVPRAMRDLLVLLPEMDGSRRSGCLELLQGYKVGNTGANLVWSADLALHYACLTGDAPLAAEMALKIADEIKIGDEEGIQKDYSFHQHGPHLQQFHYGGAFLGDCVRLAWQLRGTPWALPAGKTAILANFILEGSQWMARNNHTVPGTMDRAASRSNALFRTLAPPAQLLKETSPDFRTRLEEVIARAEGKAPPLVGFRHFPESDFTAHHRPSFSFFVKTLSTRTERAEKINKENLLGDLMNCGDAYLVAEGGEYHNLQPVWDWSLLPGVTHAPQAGPAVRKPFVGGLGDGQNGFAAMDSRFGDKENSLSCKKMWAAYGDTVVCLIADLSATAGAGPVRTALDQSRLRGAVTVGFADGSSQNPPPGSQSLEKAAWIHHGPFAYLLLEPSSVTLRTGPVSGSWRRINHDQPPHPVEDAVFLPVLEHGASLASASAAYVLAPAANPAEAERLAEEKPWKILRNDPACQAVSFPDGTVMAAFYQAGSIPGIKGLSSGQPALLLRNSSGKILREIPHSNEKS